MHDVSRVADDMLTAALATSDVVRGKGSKWCGKPATSLQQVGSAVYMQDPDHSRSCLAFADL